jgi:hypothetical protein
VGSLSQRSLTQAMAEVSVRKKVIAANIVFPLRGFYHEMKEKQGFLKNLDVLENRPIIVKKRNLYGNKRKSRSCARSLVSYF